MKPAPAAAGRFMARLLRTRWLMRLPIGLFRSGLGWVLGPRLLMIEHLGRRSGKPRYVVVEVLERGPGRFIVASGFGPGAQWYQNLRANYVAYLSTGLIRRARAHPRFLEEQESRGVLEEYGAAHPRAYRILREAMGRLQDGYPHIPLVEFTPKAALGGLPLA